MQASVRVRHSAFWYFMGAGLLLLLVPGLSACHKTRCDELRDACGLDTYDGCGPEKGTVSRVLDGDTLEFSDGMTVRLIGPDTPEKGTPFATEAMNYTQARTLSQEVELAYGPSCKDKFGRTLAYVCTGDALLNEDLIREGLATALIMSPNTCNAETFQALETEANAACKGLHKSDPNCP